MKIIALTCVLILVQLYSSFSLAQGERTIPFSLIPTSSEMNGMGYASVAHVTDNPAALMINPAHLGMQSLDNSIITLCENYSRFKPLYSEARWTLSSGVNAGINLRKYWPNIPSISIELSYSNVYVNLGTFPFDLGPDIPPTVIYQSNQLTLSAAADYIVRGSLGITYKHISNQNWPTAQEQDPGVGNDLYDIGLLVEVPFVPLISGIMNQPIPTYNKISPIFNFNIGISENNLGNQAIFSYYKYQAFPFTKFARAGIELYLGLNYVKDNKSWIPVSFKWTIESDDPLEKEDNSGDISYQSGLGDINFFKEVILGKSNKETEKLKGWELNFGEAIYIYGGRFTEDPIIGDHNFTSGGYAISVTGVFKSLAVIQPEVLESKFVRNFINNIGLKFNWSTVNTVDVNSPFNDTNFYSLSFVIKNLF
jgi:hypothetical protein